MQTVLYSKLWKLGQEGLSLKVGWDNRRKVVCISKDITRDLISWQSTLSLACEGWRPLSHPFVEQRAAGERNFEPLAWAGAQAPVLRHAVLKIKTFQMNIELLNVTFQHLMKILSESYWLKCKARWRQNWANCQPPVLLTFNVMVRSKIVQILFCSLFEIGKLCLI